MHAQYYTGQSSGDLRLVRNRFTSSSYTSGRLEVYYRGHWGTVCNDYWTRTNSDVACRQLGFPGAATPTYYRRSLSAGWVFTVVCYQGFNTECLNERRKIVQAGWCWWGLICGCTCRYAGIYVSSSARSWPKNSDISRMVCGMTIRLAGMRALTDSDCAIPISEDLESKTFLGSMPPDPPRWNVELDSL